MSDPKESTLAGWGKAVGVHLGLVGLSFVLSFLLLPRIVPFDPEGAGARAAVLGVLCSHGVAVAVCLLIPKASIKSCAAVFVLAFSFPGCVSVDAIQRWRYLRYQAVLDRFRDTVASPIPDSVTNLRFVPLEEQISPELMFRFDIAAEDLDAILTRLKMERVDPTALPNPKDFCNRSACW